MVNEPTDGSTSFNAMTVSELKEYWERAEALGLRDMIDSILPDRMPPWSKICSELDWELHLVDYDIFRAKNHGFYGVYRLIALTSEGDLNKPATLSRLCGPDASGTLYIGKSDNLGRRLNELLRSATGRSQYSHASIGRWKQISRLSFPSHKLGIALMFTGRDTSGVEKDLIKAYINSFGDAPPLNYRL